MNIKVMANEHFHIIQCLEQAPAASMIDRFLTLQAVHDRLLPSITQIWVGNI